jgi:hypothetical protein
MRKLSQALALLLLLAAPALGNENPPADLAEVRGIVLDESGQPAPGAVLTAVIEPLDPPKTKTDAAGCFALKLDRSRANYLHLLASADAGRRQALFVRDQKQPQPLDSIELRLGKTRQIEVVVVDDKQQPVSGAEAGALVSHTRVTRAQTDAQGRAVLLVPASAPLTYVYALKPKVGLDYVYFRQPEQTNDNPHWLKQDHAQPVTLSLRGAQPIVYRIVDDQEKPLPGVRVYPTWIELPQKGQSLIVNWMTVVTGDDGVARFDAMPRGIQQPIHFFATRERYCCDERLLFNPASAAAEKTVRLAPQVPVSGQVVRAGGVPAAGAKVTIVGRGYGPDGFHGEMVCNEAGQFEAYVDNETAYAAIAELDKECSPAHFFVVAPGRATRPIKIALEPATRVFGTLRAAKGGQPLADQRVSLQLEATDDYYKLPEDQRLPKKESRGSVSLWLSRRGHTDAEGRFEFFAGRGSYNLQAGGTSATAKLTGQAELELNLQSTLPVKAKLQGRVVLPTDQKHPLEGVHVRGEGMGEAHASFESATDATGSFTAFREATPARVFARSKDGLLAGVVDVKASDVLVTIPLRPAASAAGRLIDELRRKPVPNQQIQYGIKIPRNIGALDLDVIEFGGIVTTDAAGKFTLTGLATGTSYHLRAFVDPDSTGKPQALEYVGVVTAEKPGAISVGDLVLPSVPASVSNWIDRCMPPAHEASLATLQKWQKTKLRDAILAEQQVLMIVAPKKSDVCRRFAACYLGHDGLRRVSEMELQKSYRALRNYALFPVDVTPGNPLDEAQGLLKPLRIPLPEENGGTFAILDQQGNLVAAASSGDLLNDDKRLDIDKLLEFVSKHTRALPDAEQLFQNALAQAQREDKRVFVQVSGAYCAPCVYLSRYLDEHRELIAKDYVVLKLDERFVSGPEVIQRVRNEAGGIPWTVILDSTGKQLITSTAKTGNIGFPSEPEGIVHFEKMLTSTAKKLTAEEIGKLVEALGERDK